MIKWLPVKHGYRLGKQPEAVKLVLEQMEFMAPVVRSRPFVSRADGVEWSGLILERYEAFAGGTRTGEPYRSPVDLPPNHSSRHRAEGGIR